MKEARLIEDRPPDAKATGLYSRFPGSSAAFCGLTCDPPGPADRLVPAGAAGRVRHDGEGAGLRDEGRALGEAEDPRGAGPRGAGAPAEAGGPYSLRHRGGGTVIVHLA